MRNIEPLRRPGRVGLVALGCQAPLRVIESSAGSVIVG
jgi:hypothetical protein